MMNTMMLIVKMMKMRRKIEKRMDDRTESFSRFHRRTLSNTGEKSQSKQARKKRKSRETGEERSERSSEEAEGERLMDGDSDGFDLRTHILLSMEE